MGSDSHYRDERPAYRVAVGSFDIDATAMTDLHSAEFVAYTGRNATAKIPVEADTAVEQRRPRPRGCDQDGPSASFQTGSDRMVERQDRSAGSERPSGMTVKTRQRLSIASAPPASSSERDQVLNMLAVPLPHRQEPVPTRRTCEMGNRNARGVADGAPSNPIPRVRSKPAGASGRSRRVARSEANGSPKNLLGGPDT